MRGGTVVFDMQLRRFFGLVDLGILTIIVVAVIMPPREMFASSAIKGSDAEKFALALAEARTLAHPDDPARADEFSHQLGELGLKDWAVEAAIDGADRAKSSPSRWRTLLAASVAYIDRLEAKPALDYAERAFKSCTDAGTEGCPSWEKIRMDIYRTHLDAGVKAGIDPRKNPKGFREAGEGKIRTINIGGRHDREQQTPAPAPAPTR